MKVVSRMNKERAGSARVIVAAAFCLSFTGCASTTLTTTPEQAEVYSKKSGKLIGTTPMKVRMLGRDRKLVVRKDGFFSRSIKLSTIAPKLVDIPLDHRRTQLLISSPRGARVFAEGELVGFTPYRIDYGKPCREYELHAPGYFPETVIIPENPAGNVVATLKSRRPVTNLECACQELLPPQQECSPQEEPEEPEEEEHSALLPTLKQNHLALAKDESTRRLALLEALSNTPSSF